MIHSRHIRQVFQKVRGISALKIFACAEKFLISVGEAQIWILCATLNEITSWVPCNEEFKVERGDRKRPQSDDHREF